MLSIPALARGFAIALLCLGLYLAIENTLITAEVLADKSGASVVASVAFAFAATGLEIAFISWLRSDRGASGLLDTLMRKPLRTVGQLFILGIGLALVYHFDIMTTAQHPRFNTGAPYFFSVVVLGFVFGPEACIVLGGWLWGKVRDTETRRLQTDNLKDAENMKLKSERELLLNLAKQAGQEDAITKARERWGRHANASS